MKRNYFRLLCFIVTFFFSSMCFSQLSGIIGIYTGYDKTQVHGERYNGEVYFQIGVKYKFMQMNYMTDLNKPLHLFGVNWQIPIIPREKLEKIEGTQLVNNVFDDFIRQANFDIVNIEDLRRQILVIIVQQAMSKNY